MGWFGKENKGYVSPFDADNGPDYIDPSKALAAEHKRQASPASAESHGNDKEYDQLRRPPLPDAPKTKAPNPGHQPPRPERRQSESVQPRHDDSKAAGETGDPSVDVDSTSSTSGWAIFGSVLWIVAWLMDNPWLAIAFAVAAIACSIGAMVSIRKHRGEMKGMAIAVIVLLLSFSVCVSQVNALRGVNDSPLLSMLMEKADKADSSMNDEPDDYSSTPRYETVPEYTENKVSLSDYDSKHNGTVSIDDAVPVSPSGDSTAQQAVMVTYTFENKGPAKISMLELADTYVFQNDSSLRMGNLYPEYGDEAPADYDRESINRAVDPGKTATVTVAYELTEPSAPLEVWVSDYCFEKVGFAGFQRTADGTGLERVHIAPAALPELPGKDDLKDYKEAKSYSNHAYIRFLSAVPGPKDYDGSSTVIVTYEWVNAGVIPASLLSMGNLTAKAGGQSLERTYLGDPSTPVDPAYGFDRYSPTAFVKGHCTAKTTIAYRLPKSTGTAEVEFKYFADGSKPLLSNTVTIDL